MTQIQSEEGTSLTYSTNGLREEWGCVPDIHINRIIFPRQAQYLSTDPRRDHHPSACSTAHSANLMTECETSSACSSQASPLASARGTYAPGASREDGNDTSELGTKQRRSAGVGVPLQANDAVSGGFAANKPLFPTWDNPMAVLPLSSIDEYNNPLAYLLSNGPTNTDPSGFGLGSIVDGTLGERPRTTEELRLFRSQKLLQAEAASVALNPIHGEKRQKLCQISSNLARQVRQAVRDHANAASGLLPHLGQEDIMDGLRENCHRVLTGFLDAARSALSEISGGAGNTPANVPDELPTTPRLSLRDALQSSTSQENPIESQQLASSWENVATSMRPSTSHAANSMTPSSVNHSFIQMPPLMTRPGVFTLSHMRDRASLPPFAQCLPGTLKTGSKTPLGSVLGSGMYPPPSSGAVHGVGMGSTGGFAVPLSHAGICGQNPIMDSWHLAGGGMGAERDGGHKQTPSFLTKAEEHASVVSMSKVAKGELGPRRPGQNNRKGSRHRLTPQAKAILEHWLAMNWHDPYPSEDEKISLAQACHITVTQVNNWMMNVRVRRCRTRKIGVATGPDQMSHSSCTPRALSVNKTLQDPPLCHEDDVPDDDTGNMGKKPRYNPGSDRSFEGPNIRSSPRRDQSTSSLSSSSSSPPSSSPSVDEERSSQPNKEDSSDLAHGCSSRPNLDVRASPWRAQEGQQGGEILT